jgi:hypothetical protein
MGVARVPLCKSIWKSQLLNNEQYNMRTAHRDEQYNTIVSRDGGRNCSMMSSIIQELLIVSRNTKRRHGSHNCSLMSSIMKELLIVSSITKDNIWKSQLRFRSHATRRRAVCSRRSVLEAPRMDPRSRPAEPQDYTQNRWSQEWTASKSAWRAARRLQSSCTGVHSRTRQRSAMVLIMNYANHRSDGD